MLEEKLKKYPLTPAPGKTPKNALIAANIADGRFPTACTLFYIL